MKVIKVKKSYRNGEITHHIIFNDDASDDLIRDVVEDWADGDPAGQMYGYKIDFVEVSDEREKLDILQQEVVKVSKQLHSLNSRHDNLLNAVHELRENIKKQK